MECTIKVWLEILFLLCVYIHSPWRPKDTIVVHNETEGTTFRYYIHLRKSSEILEIGSLHKQLLKFENGWVGPLSNIPTAFMKIGKEDMNTHKRNT